jgi:hypothetical protein
LVTLQTNTRGDPALQKQIPFGLTASSIGTNLQNDLAAPFPYRPQTERAKEV